MPASETIDKHTFLAALACDSAAWYAQRAPGQEMSPALAWQFYGGNQVGEAARIQLGSGLMLPRTPLALAQDTTQRMIAEPATALLFEASFQDGAFVARADAIRRLSDGWDLIEVKSALQPAEGKKLDPALIDDMAFTAMVAHGARLPIVRCTLLLLSRAYRLGAPDPLLVELDVTKAVLARAEEFAAVSVATGGAILGANRPDPALKLTCRSCAYFTSDCLGHGVEKTIFMLPGLSEKRLKQIRPIVDLTELPDSVDLTDNQQRVFDVMRSGTPLVMDGLARLDDVVWPAFYLDFETVSPVLPWFIGDAAREQHTFQYSIHVCDGIGHIVSHREYLAENAGDWRRDLTVQLLTDLGEHGSIVVFTNFERDRLGDLAALFPDLAMRLNGVIDRLWDLNDVIKHGYCHPGFKGSTSIKKVLPVMVPELGYDGMAIAEGQSASGAFGLMRVGAYDAATFDEWRRDLLAYCKLDTLAMVRVHEALARVRHTSSAAQRGIL